MTVTLELSPEEAEALKSRADAEGIDMETVLHGLIARLAPPRALMQAWRQEDATDDPEERAERDQEREELKANLDRWHAEEGWPHEAHEGGKQ